MAGLCRRHCRLPAALALLHCALASRQPAYDERDALTYVQYARAAFCTKSSLAAWDCGDACDAVSIVPGSMRFFGPSKTWAVQGYVAKMPAPSYPGHCIIAFRGSTQWQNWVADANFFMKKWPLTSSGQGASWCRGCKVHHGFALAYKELRGAMIFGMRSLNCTGVTVTGHSLGGALASLAVMELRGNPALNVWVRKVYTFGKPRVGNLAYATAWMAAAAKQGARPASWRVVHYNDPVARLPPAIPGLTYVHEMHEVWYTARGSTAYRECETNKWKLVNSYEDSTCSRSTPLVDCINLDHVTYLNLTFAHKEMEKKCTGKERRPFLFA